jgi:hypothetical protein
MPIWANICPHICITQNSHYADNSKFVTVDSMNLPIKQDLELKINHLPTVALEPCVRISPEKRGTSFERYLSKTHKLTLPIKELLLLQILTTFPDSILCLNRQNIMKEIMASQSG